MLARYQQLGTIDQGEEQGPMVLATPISNNGEEPPGATESQEQDEQAFFQDLELDETLDAFGQKETEAAANLQQGEPDLFSGAGFQAEAAGNAYSEPTQLENSTPSEAKDFDIPVNEMFADLMEEFSSPSNQKTAKEAFDEHFHLGTAYHEMDLMEEAIREFENALKALDYTSTKDTKRVVQCCGMLSTCFLKKGMPRSAVRYCQTGLSVADISSHEAMALRYDMGVAHSMAGSSEMALKCFDRIFGMDPSYRDVAQKIDELRAAR